MQTPTRMNKVVIEDYYHMTTMNETNTSIVKFPANPRVPFCTSTFTSTFLIAFLHVHTREKQYLFFVYTMYVNASNNTPSYTYMVRMKRPPLDYILSY